MTFCSACGLALDETNALPFENRKPCPQCGGLTRSSLAASTLSISSNLAANTTLIHVLDSVSKYYSEVLKPKYDEFFAAPATLRSAFNLARNLFHFHDWLFASHKAELQAHFGKTLLTAGEFWIAVEGIDARLGFIRDVANASKHVRLTKRPSTSVTHVANIFLEVGDAARVKMKDNSRDVEFDDCARELFQYWTALSWKIGVLA
jgi:hypothetical protein